MKGMIDETELARLEELAGKASKGPFFEDGFDVQDDDDNEVACCNRSDDLSEDVQEANTHYIAAACNSVPALVAEIRRLREALSKEHRAWQCAEGRGDGLEMENSALREKVDAWEWLFEVLEYDVYEDHPLAGRWGYADMSDNERAAYTNARVSHASIEKAAREAVHADRE